MPHLYMFLQMEVIYKKKKKRKSLFMKLTVGFIERKSLIKQSWICGNRKKLLNQ